jgi:hypothetical protein
VRYSTRSLIFVTLIALSAVAALAADNFLLARNRVGRLTISMPKSAIYVVYPRRITKKVALQLEGFPTPAVQVFLAKSRLTPSLVIRLDGPVPGIYGIEVTDARFRTSKGVGVGSSFGQLRATEKLSFVTGEGVIGAVSKELSMTFDLDVDSATENRLYELRLHKPLDTRRQPRSLKFQAVHNW